MKILLLIFSLALTACNGRIFNYDNDLKSIMAYGSMEELNNLKKDEEQDLLVRLYKLPIYIENCFKETHGICQYKYYISVSTFDEHPDTNIFELANTGEITDIIWLPEEKYDYVELELTFNKYTKEALKNNPSLEKKILKVLLKLDPENITEKTI